MYRQRLFETTATGDIYTGLDVSERRKHVPRKTPLIYKDKKMRFLKGVSNGLSQVF
jgi:hypothetical protein